MYEAQSKPVQWKMSTPGVFGLDSKNMKHFFQLSNPPGN